MRMKITKLERRANTEADKKLKTHYNFLENLIVELNTKELPLEIIKLINQDIEVLNRFEGSDKDFLKLMGKKQTGMLQLLEKELSLVCKGHYRNMWLALGMAVFGLPMGTLFGLGLGNMAYIGMGLPLGIALGAAYGTSLDKKAYEEGRQLEVEIVQ